MNFLKLCKIGKLWLDGSVFVRIEVRGKIVSISLYSGENDDLQFSDLDVITMQPYKNYNWDKIRKLHEIYIKWNKVQAPDDVLDFLKKF